MSQRRRKVHYWQDAPIPREQLVLIPTALEELIPPDHPVRLVDEILDQLDWSAWEAEYHGGHGQPPIHPKVMAKILLFAMIRRIRSSRNIEYELIHSIDFIWLASGRRVDHTTISEFRRKHSKALRDIFKQMINLAIQLGIANLSELCIDGTRVLANANRYKTWTAARLAKALEELDAQIAEALKTLETNDSRDEDLLGEDISADRLPESVRDLKARREQLNVHMETAKAMDATRKLNGTKGPGQIPKGDPDSRILPSKEGGYAANYTPMVTTECTGGFIVLSDVLIGNVEHQQFGTIVDTVQADFDVNVERALVDSAYTTGENLTLAEAKEVEMIGPLAEQQCVDNPAIREDLTQAVPVEDRDRLPMNPCTKRIDKSGFIYDEQSDTYYCPMGKPLRYHKMKTAARVGGKSDCRKVYLCFECGECPLAQQCLGKSVGKKGREIHSDQHESARRRHRKRMQRTESQETYLRRQHIGEHPFAVIKSRFDLRRFLLRGKAGVETEWRWAAAGFNLLKLMSVWHDMRADFDSPRAMA